MKRLLLLGCLVAPAALAAPRIESVTVRPNPAAFAGGKAPQVEIVVAVGKAKFGPNNCDASVDPGDGARPRTLDFGLATTRSLRHVYGKNGTYKVTVRGAGAAPCEGAAQAAVTVTGAPAPKKAPEKKKVEPKKKPVPKKKGAKAPSSKEAAKP